MKVDLNYFELLQISSALHIVDTVYGTVESQFIERIDHFLDVLDSGDNIT